MSGTIRNVENATSSFNMTAMTRGKSASYDWISFCLTVSAPRLIKLRTARVMFMVSSTVFNKYIGNDNESDTPESRLP